MPDKNIVSKEIRLKKRPTGFVTEDDFELVKVMVPELKKEGENKESIRSTNLTIRLNDIVVYLLG